MPAPALSSTLLRLFPVIGALLILHPRPSSAPPHYFPERNQPVYTILTEAPRRHADRFFIQYTLTSMRASHCPRWVVKLCAPFPSFLNSMTLAHPFPSIAHHKWPEMVEASHTSDNAAMAIHRRGSGSHERPKDLFSRAEALRKRLRYARRHFH